MGLFDESPSTTSPFHSREQPAECYLKSFFQRKPWLKDRRNLSFAWNDRAEAWEYIKFSGTKWDFIGSWPSETVLSSNDLVEVTLGRNGYARKIKGNKMADLEFNKKSKAASYIGGEYIVVRAKAKETIDPKNTPYTKIYSFKMDKLLAASVKEGDLVVVDGGILTIMMVQDVLPMDLKNPDTVKAYNNIVGWVVDTIDTKDQLARMAATDRKEVIMKQLHERKEAAEELAIFALLAKEDPQVAKMLEELKALTT